MAIDLAALAAELQNQKYQGLDDQPCADLLNTADLPYTLTSLSRSTVLVLGNTFKGIKFGYLAANQAVPAAVSYLIDDVMPDVAKQDSLDLTLPQVQQMIGAIQQAGLLTADQVTALKAGTRSRAEEMFGPGVTVGHMDVGTARLMGANE